MDIRWWYANNHIRTDQEFKEEFLNQNIMIYENYRHMNDHKDKGITTLHYSLVIILIHRLCSLILTITSIGGKGNGIFDDKYKYA